METTYWEHFEHKADIGVRGVAPTLTQAFEQAALAMTAVITDLARVKPEQVIRIECAAPDDEILFLEWLDSLIYEMATRKMLFSRFQVSIRNHQLTGEAWGEPVSVDKHHPAVEIKGATFTELKVTQDPHGSWLAQCVVDV